jgi:hypothetical protein
MEISNDLEQHHALFYQCWQLGKPRFTEDIPTAAVAFSDGECIDFLFNPKFWNSIDHYTRLFVIAHECLHVILSHGIRTLNQKFPRLTNQCLDLPVNHLLVTRFGFDRSKVNNADKACWVDTVFKDDPRLPTIPTDESFEYYYNLTPKSDLDSLDLHSLLNGDWSSIVDRIGRNLTPEERESVLTAIKGQKDSQVSNGVGNGVGNWTTIRVEPVSKKKKWETIIKKWSLKYLKEDVEEKEQWARIHRRSSCIPDDLMLPSEMEDDAIEKDRLPVFFFMDTSGSCWNLKERFFKAARSLPEDRFKVRLFCFDTRIKETTIESNKIYGGGGTSFRIIEQHIQNLIKNENIKYPEAVFLITDGAGDTVVPEYPERWFWFLSGNYRKLIPKGSKIFNLKDFE